VTQLLVGLWLAAALGQPLDVYDVSSVGPLPNGRIVVPTNQILAPAGTQVEFANRPTDLALSPDGQTLAVLNMSEVLLLDLETATVKTRVETGDLSWAGIAFLPDGKTVVASSASSDLVFLPLEPPGARVVEKLRIPCSAKGESAPCGMALSRDASRLYVAVSRNDSVAEIDLARRALVREVKVGKAPYGVLLVGGKMYVSNWGGRVPREGDVTGPAGDDDGSVVVDPRTHVAASGTVSVVDLASWQVTGEVEVGLHPSAMVANAAGTRAYVANANSDTVSVIDTATDAVAETIPVRPAYATIFGSSPNALALSADESILYVANGTNNALCVVALSGKARGAAGPQESRVLGFLPTGWYPGQVMLDRARGRLCVANVKGVGPREVKRPDGFNSREHRGSVSLIDVPDAGALAAYTAIVEENNRRERMLAAMEAPRPEAQPVPVPDRHGEPSVFKHVLYIIKENRTYDQVFGDMPEGNGMPELCDFGEYVTPNQHKLALEFTLFDNLYCSGVLSADGHQWTDEAYVTDYLEKGFGDFPRSYPYDGGDAIAYAPTGFIWDNALAHERTLRVYGEFVNAHIEPKGVKFTDILKDWRQATSTVKIWATANIATLEPHICPTFVGFPGVVPDVWRARQFLYEFRRFEASGELPNLMIMLLPNDHTTGTRPGMPTPRAAVADNDLALGEIVDTVSHSQFWPETCIFVIEDDPQAGWDHVDGHRTVGLVISPYTRRHYVDSTNYNQVSMVKTIEMMLGLPPMNQMDATATPMRTCFAERPDLTFYDHVSNNVALDELNPPVQALSGQAREDALLSLALPLDEIDEAPEDAFNRILWRATMGYERAYPEEYALSAPRPGITP
jgi:YVTN family beta-propeller protein